MEPGLRNRSLSEKSDVAFKCSGEFCGSCSASFFADCVAVSCCPCAVISLLAFTFAKLPWLVGRRLIGRLQKKLQKRRKIKEEEEKQLEKREEKTGVVEGRFAFDAEDFEIIRRGFEAEKALMELYQVAHLGFGSLSFTGIQVKS